MVSPTTQNDMIGNTSEVIDSGRSLMNDGKKAGADYTTGIPVTHSVDNAASLKPMYPSERSSFYSTIVDLYD